MAELAKKLHLKKGTTEHLAKAYSTTAEAGAEYITNKIDGVTAYVPIGATNDSRATIGRVKKSGGTEKVILTMGKPPYTKKQWTTPGPYTFTVPQGVTKIRVTMSGGGGAGGNTLSGTLKRGGGGGGAGGYIKNYVMNVDSNSTIAIVVGTGGTIYPETLAEASKVGSIFANSGGNGETGGDGGIGGTTTLGDSGANGQSHSGRNGGKGGDSGDGTPGGAGGMDGGNGQNGSRGSGGGGGSISTYGASKPGNGGNGFVIIEYGGDI